MSGPSGSGNVNPSLVNLSVPESSEEDANNTYMFNGDEKRR